MVGKTSSPEFDLPSGSPWEEAEWNLLFTNAMSIIKICIRVMAGSSCKGHGWWNQGM